MKVVVLGAGFLGAEVAGELAKSGAVDDVVVADFDASDAAGIDAVIAGADVVFNGSGPFQPDGMTIIRSAVAAGVHYVDAGNEFDVAEKLINNTDLDVAAKEAGVTVLTGMGEAPGMTNLAARWAVEGLTSAHTVNVVLGVPFRVDLGVTHNNHLLHSMTGTVPQFVDGAYHRLPAWGDPQPYTLVEPFGTHDFGYMGHPESLTLPRYLPGLRNAFARFAWFEPAGVQLWKDLDRFGFLGGDVLEGMSISPREFLARYMSTDVGRTSLSVDVGEQLPGSAWQVAVDGERDGVPTRIAIEGHILAGRQGENVNGLTAVPAAAGVLELIAGRLTRRGVVAPEACIDPEPFMRKVAATTGMVLYRKVTQVDRVDQ